MNEEHFEMMESHFSASLYECLCRKDVIQCCLRLFANLISFFQDNSLSANNDEDEKNEDEESVTGFDDDEEDDIMSESCHSEADSVLFPMPPRNEAKSYVTKRVQDALSQSERSSDSGSIRSVESKTISSFESRIQTQGNVNSYVSRRIQEALEKTDRSSRSRSIHSMTHKKNNSAIKVSKRIEYVSDRYDPLKDSQRTEATVSSGTSEDVEAGIRQLPVVLSKRSKGKPKMLFSWKKTPFRSSKKAAVSKQ
jgi:hypothetical protein